MKRRAIIGMFVSGWLLSLGPSVDAGEPLQYEPAVVQLSGVLVVEVHYGPPNYGENPESDMVERAMILLLDMPQIVQGDLDADFNGETEYDVARVHLAASPEIGLSKLVWQRVRVEGTLFHAFTGHHRTDVLMSVSRVIESGPIR